MKKQFKITVSYFVRGQLKTIEKTVSTSSIGMAWKTGAASLPTTQPNSCQIKVEKA